MPDTDRHQAIRAACESCIGRTREVHDTLAPEPARKLAVILGQDLQGEVLPPTFHWAYFNPAIPLADQGRDMHEKPGLFLPAAPFQRRMRAAGDITVLRPLRIGHPATQRSTLSDVVFKEGCSGAMCFVTVTQQIEQGGVPCIIEEETIVYRDRGTPDTGLRAPGDPVPEGYFTYPDSLLYFYSAVTHNGHRIHWDRDFCRDTEGYPDLVVHGPLMATQLCEAMRADLTCLRFRYRALAPVFATTPVRLQTGAADPEAEREGYMERSDGVISMRATLTPL